MPLGRRIHIGERSLFRRRSALDVHNLRTPDPQDVTASVIGVAPLLCFARGAGRMINGQSQSERERPDCMNSGTGRLICIGGATVDWTYRTKDAVHLRTSNPATSERSFGGVARNVAENVARLGAHSSLVSVLGGDENGRAIRESLDRLDIDTRHIGISADHATAEYVAVLQPNGDLVL